MIGQPIAAGAPADQGKIMTLDPRITYIVTGALLTGTVIWAYVGVCFAYAVDCY